MQKLRVLLAAENDNRANWEPISKRYLQQAEAEEAAIVEQLRHQNRTLHERLVRLKRERVPTHER